MNDTQRVSNLALFLVEDSDDWMVAYELSEGDRTGRWQVVNEAKETDEFFPGFWLPQSTLTANP